MLVFLSGMIGVAVGGKDVDVYVAVGAEVEATTMPVGVRGSVIGVYVAGAADLHPAAIVHIKSAHLKSSHLVEISDIKNSKIGYEWATHKQALYPKNKKVQDAQGVS